MFLISCVPVSEEDLADNLTINNDGDIDIPTSQTPVSSTGNQIFDNFQNVMQSRCISCHFSGSQTPGNFSSYRSIQEWKDSPYISSVGNLASSSAFSRLKGAGVNGVENMPLGSNISGAEIKMVKDFVESLQPATISGALEVEFDYAPINDGSSIVIDTAFHTYGENGAILKLKNPSLSSLTIESVTLPSIHFYLEEDLAGRVIYPNQSLELRVRLKTNQYGSFSSQLSIATNSLITPNFNVAISGVIQSSPNCQDSKIKKDFEIQTNEFIKFAIEDLFNVRIDNIEEHLLPNIPVADRNLTKVGDLSLAFFNLYETLIGKVADVALGLASHNGVVKVGDFSLCNLSSLSSSNISSCIQQTFNPLLLRALGKGYSVSDFSQALVLIPSDNEAETPKEVYKDFMYYLLLNPHFLVYFEDVGSSVPETDLVKLYYMRTWNSVPTYDHAVAGFSSTFNQNKNQNIDNILNDSKFHDRGLRSFFDVYLDRDYVYSELSINGVSDPVKYSLYSSFRRSVKDHYFENNDLSQILTSDKMYLDSNIGNFIGSPNNIASLTKVTTTEFKGAHRHPAFLARTAKHTSEYEEPLSPRRGNIFNNMFVCEEFNSIQPSDLHIPVNPNISHKRQFEQRTNGAACIGCHKTLNSLGFSLQEYDFYGEKRAVDIYGFPHDTSGIFKGRKFNNADELAQILTRKRQYQVCFAKHFFNYMIGNSSNLQNKCYIDKAMSNQESITMKNVFRNLLRNDGLKER